MNAVATSDSKTISARTAFAFPWQPDRGDGTYRNPVLYADYSDPDVVRVGEDFYLTASSFNCTPGLPILHSKDLVNWTLIGHALKNLPHPRYAAVQPGCGVWAPAIRFHAGKFWIFYPTPDEGIFLVMADDPAGKWSDPHLVQAGKGLIDPCPLWNDDGKAYLVHAYANSRAGIKDCLRVCPMAPDGSRLLGTGKIVFQQPQKHPTVEGPKFLKKDGWYYIFAPAGGVETGWQLALRSKNVFGPYEEKIVLAQGGTDINGPHQGGLVNTPAGEWWFVHFQDAGVYGRIVHLQPVVWQDHWPLMGRNAEPVSHHAKPSIIKPQTICVPQTSDEFDSAVLKPQWQWHANHRDDWLSPAARPGWLRLLPQTAAASLHEQPNLLLQKFPAHIFTAETLLEFSSENPGDEAGLVVTGRTFAALVIRRAASKNQIVFRNNDQDEVLHDFAGRSLKLRVEVAPGGLCSFSFAAENNFVVAPKTFQATAGHWIGAKLGLFSLKLEEKMLPSHADFDYFRFK